MSDVRIIQAGTSEGSFSDGTEQGPAAMLAAGLERLLQQSGLKTELVDIPTVEPHTQSAHDGVRQARSLVPWLQAVLAATLRSSSGRALTLGGDHSVAIPSLMATKRRYHEAVCVYIDAHPDSNDIASSPTGNLHGMPLRVVTGEVLADQFQAPYFQPDELCFIGIKDIDDAEAEWIARHGVRAYTMDTVIERGIASILQDVQAWIAHRPLHVSFDIDVIDSQYAPGTGIRNAGGLTYREADYLARRLGALQPVAVDVVELNPARDLSGQTTRLAVELAVALLGGKWSEYDRYLESEH